MNKYIHDFLILSTQVSERDYENNINYNALGRYKLLCFINIT